MGIHGRRPLANLEVQRRPAAPAAVASRRDDVARIDPVAHLAVERLVVAEEKQVRVLPTGPKEM